MPPKCILITGVSSGIGLATAKLLHGTHHRVIATARPASLSKIPADLKPHDHFCILPLDVTDDTSRRAAVTEATQRFGSIDVLINNAGVSFRSAIEDLSDEDEHRQMETNYVGPMAMIRLVLPSMRDRRSGTIINVSSVGGMMAMPLMGAYSASKFALEGASEALWYEVRPWRVCVVLVQPGFIRSDSFRRVLKGKVVVEDGEDKSPYSKVYKNMARFIESGMMNTWSTPESVARAIVKVIDSTSPPLRVPATVDAHLFALLRRVLPRRMYHYILYRLLPGVKTWSDL